MQSGGNQMEFDHESFQMAVGLLSGDRDGCEDVFKPHHNWLNQASWAGLGSGSGSGSCSGSGSTPGGPLGEALCLGITSTQNEPSFHGYSCNTNNSSACKGGGLNFVNIQDGLGTFVGSSCCSQFLLVSYLIVFKGFHMF
ncbi:hypothetical protein HanXRQr2_Chr11g0507941 [Helianthus annuus]|uniref:Uncharacterized protein n=1 Tax=Helianthus annuus TaxID=4232 RepID=A0A9K3HS00_HELAN|nr:hypothetical protein HanXRQr2_Chr11g0507941 [Helianthus annuus]KAJ0502760.1 putative growth-regulating factor [Helianthus annuus]KAJ0518720.1 putative growth-regulating factor [Helianthus annuus]